MDKNSSQSKRSIFISCMPKIITGFSIVAFGILLFFLVFKLSSILTVLKEIIEILNPIIYGLVIAYLINPIVDGGNNLILKLISKFMLPGEKTKKITKTMSIILGLIFFIFVIIILLVLIVPELVSSISGFIGDFPENFAAFQLWLNKKIENNPDLVSAISTSLSSIMNYVQSYFENKILPKMDIFIGQFTNIIMGTLNIIKNLIIGIIVTVYTLNNKETFKGQAKKIIYAALKPEYADVFLDTIRHSHKIFIGFISGKILDSVIIGVICFIGLSILKMPYTLLVSVIVGVTNIIPFFGPYIGAIPSAILILIVSPVKGLHFIIFVMILQQFDGNILGPKILGDSTGLPPFWVLFSILLGGGLLGIFGMIIGVPTFAVVYYIFKTFIENILRKKNLPVETIKYTNIDDFSSISNKK